MLLLQLTYSLAWNFRGFVRHKGGFHDLLLRVSCNTIKAYVTETRNFNKLSLKIKKNDVWASL